MQRITITNRTARRQIEALRVHWDQQRCTEAINMMASMLTHEIFGTSDPVEIDRHLGVDTGAVQESNEVAK